jgi:hypothetical protein
MKTQTVLILLAIGYFVFTMKKEPLMIPQSKIDRILNSGGL